MTTWLFRRLFRSAPNMTILLLQRAIQSNFYFIVYVCEIFDIKARHQIMSPNNTPFVIQLRNPIKLYRFIQQWKNWEGHTFFGITLITNWLECLFVGLTVWLWLFKPIKEPIIDRVSHIILRHTAGLHRKPIVGPQNAVTMGNDISTEISATRVPGVWNLDQTQKMPPCHRWAHRP